MASVNKVILLGNLGKDPEMRALPNGDAVVNFSIATSENWKDKDGNKKEKTEWHNIIMFRKLAEIAKEYLKKGGSVYLEGSLQTRKWTDKEGKERYTTEVVATSMQMLGKKEDSNQAPANMSKGHENPINAGSQPPNFDDFDDDIPF